MLSSEIEFVDVVWVVDVWMLTFAIEGAFEGLLEGFFDENGCTLSCVLFFMPSFAMRFQWWKVELQQKQKQHIEKKIMDINVMQLVIV